MFSICYVFFSTHDLEKRPFFNRSWTTADCNQKHSFWIGTIHNDFARILLMFWCTGSASLFLHSRHYPHHDRDMTIAVVVIVVIIIMTVTNIIIWPPSVLTYKSVYKYKMDASSLPLSDVLSNQLPVDSWTTRAVVLQKKHGTTFSTCRFDGMPAQNVFSISRLRIFKTKHSQWFLVNLTHTIHVWYIYLHWVNCYGKYRYIYHTWMVWVIQILGTKPANLGLFNQTCL